jgi:hypothetical protein
MRLSSLWGGPGGSVDAPRLSRTVMARGRAAFKHAWIAGVCVILLLPTIGCEKDTSIVMPSAEDASPTVQNTIRAQVNSSIPTVDRQKVFFFGTIISTGEDGLLVEMEQPQPEVKQSTKYWAEVLPGRGFEESTVHVSVDDDTALMPDDGGLESLEPGTPVMVGGLAQGGGLTGHFVIDLRRAERYTPSQAEQDAVAEAMDWRVTEGLQLAELPGMALGLKRFIEQTHGALETAAEAMEGVPSVEDFPGNFGGPTWVWDTGDLDIPLLLIPYVELNRIIVTVGLGGATYNFPFSFQADGTALLFVGQAGDLEVQVEPQARDPYTYSWALGFNIAFHLKVCFITGCDNYVYDFNLLSTVIQTTDPAPMPDEMLNIEPIACPSWDVSLGVIDALGVQFCEEQKFGGDFFYSDVEIQNSSLWNHFYYVGFDGADPKTYQVLPITNPLNVLMDEFYYHPHMSVGIYARTYLLDWTIYQFPTIHLADGEMNIIPTDQTSCEWYGSWLGTCGDEQPSSLELIVPVIPVVTSISSMPNPSRFGEMVTFQALVRGANGPATGPKEVTFYDGDTPLATVPIDGDDIATFETSALSPCKHMVAAEYIGYDANGNAHPSRKTLAQIVTGDADWTRREGYWQHQCNGNGKVDFDSERLECYLSIVEHMSMVFDEVRDISSPDMAYDVLFMKQNGGSAVEQLDRELLVAWLNYANGGIAYDELLDSDGDGFGDTLLLNLMQAAETVRLNPNSTVKEIKEQAGILHHVIQMQVP